MRKLLVPLAALAAIAALPAPAQTTTTTTTLGTPTGSIGGPVRNRDFLVGAQVPAATNTGTGTSSTGTTSTNTSGSGTSSTTTTTNSSSGSGATSTTTSSSGTGATGTTGTTGTGTGTGAGNETTTTATSGTGTETGTGTPATNTAVIPVPSGSLGYFAGGIAAPDLAFPDYGAQPAGNGAVIVNNNNVVPQRTATPNLDRAVSDYSRRARSSREQSMWSTSPRTNNDRTWQMPDDYTPLMPGSR